MPEAKITVSILSWLLEEKLIETLIKLPRTTSMPLNLCLQIQGCERLSPPKRQAILDATSAYMIRDVFFTRNNNGSAKPRAALLKRSAITPYIFITDNDMTFQPGSLDAMLSFMESEDGQPYGMIDLVHNYLKWHRTVEGTKVTSTPVDHNQQGIIPVDLIGAASLLMRREVALIPNIIDTNYHLGVWDFDLCMNVKRANWKIGTLSDKRYIAINDKTARNLQYLKEKVRNPIRINGIKRFRKKWGFCSEDYPGSPVQIEQPKPAQDTLIITRAIYERLGSSPDLGTLDPDRISMFQSNFINSLKAQTNKEFTIYVFVSSLNNEATQLIQSLDWTGLDVNYLPTTENLKEWKRSSSVSQNSGREIDSGCPEDLARRFGHPTAPIMARLDIDDWVAPGWVSHMKYMASKISDSRFLINYQVIGQAPDGRLYRFFAPHTRKRVSPFLSIVQREDPIVSPYEDLHLKMGSFFENIYTVPPSYAYMVVHGNNRSNRLYDGDSFIGNPDNMVANPNKETPKVINMHSRSPHKFSLQKNDWRSRILNSSLKN